MSDNMILICKPEQSGKTFVMLDLIKNQVDSITKPPLNIVFCDNNLLLTLQTSFRFNTKDVSPDDSSSESQVYDSIDSIDRSDINVESDVSDTSDLGETIEFSSHHRTPFNDAESVIDALKRNKGSIKNILCCTNGQRVKDIVTIANSISRDYQINLWIDEADKYIRPLSTHFYPLTNDIPTIKIYCITATPHELFKRFKKMRVHPLQSVVRPEYHGWNDNHIFHSEKRESTIEFVEAILMTHRKKILPGSRWFVPADYEKSSHFEIASLCNRYNMAALIINGDGFRFMMPDKTIKIIKKNKSLQELFEEIYKDPSLNLDRYALAITGNLCVGRGISFISEGFRFDYGILSSITSPQSASQNAGRIKGNIKELDNYEIPTIFTTKEFDIVATQCEIQSRRVAKIANDLYEAGREPVLTNEDFKNIVSRQVKRN